MNSYCQEKNNYYHALREQKELGFKNSYRILNTTINSLSGFKVIIQEQKFHLKNSKILSVYLLILIKRLIHLFQWI